MVRTLRSSYRLCDTSFVILYCGGIARCSDPAWLGAGIEDDGTAKMRTSGVGVCVDDTRDVRSRTERSAYMCGLAK